MRYLWMAVLTVKDELKKWLNWIFPFYCLGCGKVDNAICEECLLGAPRCVKQVCGYCRVEAVGGKTCEFCVEGGAALSGLLVATVYTKKGLIAQGLHNFKYNGQMEFGEALVGFLDKFLEQGVTKSAKRKAQSGGNCDDDCGVKIAKRSVNSEVCEDFGGVRLEDFIICPIPLFPAKELARGFNQSEFFARRISLDGVRLNLLRRVSYKLAQATLSGAERLENVKGVFEFVSDACEDLPEKVLLIDDVATTLATLEEAAWTLRNAGIKDVYGLVLAREDFETERKRL